MSRTHFPFRLIEGLPRVAQEQLLRDLEQIAGAIPAGSLSAYDAIIDASVTVSTPSTHIYKNLTEAVTGEGKTAVTGNDSGENSPFRIAVVPRSTFTITESGAINCQVPIVMDVLGHPRNTGTETGGVAGMRQRWDLNGQPVSSQTGGGVGHTVTLRGLDIFNSGGAISNAFQAAVLALYDCRINQTDLANPPVVKITSPCSGTLYAHGGVLVDLALGSGADAFLYDTEVLIYRTVNYTLTNGQRFYWIGGFLNAGFHAAVQITFSATTTFIGGVAFGAVGDFSGGFTPTIIVGSTGHNVIEFLAGGGTGTGPNINVLAAAGQTQVRGSYNTVTWPAPTTVGSGRLFDGTISASSTLNGPGQFTVASLASAVITFSGVGVRADLSAQKNGANPPIALVNCDDSLIVATISSSFVSGATAYTIDAASDRSVLVVSGSNSASYSTRTNSSTTTIVIDESGAVPKGTAAGSLAGSYPSPTFAGRDSSVDQINKDLLPGALGDVVASPLVYPPVTGSAPTGTAGGALAGTYPNPTFAGRNASVDAINKDIALAAMLLSTGLAGT